MIIVYNPAIILFTIIQYSLSLTRRHFVLHQISILAVELTLVRLVSLNALRMIHLYEYLDIVNNQINSVMIAYTFITNEVIHDYDIPLDIYI